MTEDKKGPVELTLVFQVTATGKGMAKSLIQESGEAFHAICKKHGLKLEDGATKGGAVIGTVDLLNLPTIEPEVGPGHEKVSWKDKIRFATGRTSRDNDPKLN